ncbi:MAG: hypothetical protein ACJZ6A_08125 [Candidatus Poseidoniaceae archaeon]
MFHRWGDTTGQIGKRPGTFAAVIFIPFAGLEATYLATAPDASSSSALGGVGDYAIEGTYSYHVLADDSTYVNDGDTVDIMTNSDAAGSEINGKNIVGVRATLTFTDDETQQGLPCNFAQPPQDDDVSGNMMHYGFEQSSPTQSGDSVTLEWHDSSIIGTTVSNMSESEIMMMLDGEFGIGEHSLGISVNVNTGGGAGCTTTDEGEEVAYTIELISLEYTIEMV